MREEGAGGCGGGLVTGSGSAVTAIPEWMRRAGDAGLCRVGGPDWSATMAAASRGLSVRCGRANGGWARTTRGAVRLKPRHHVPALVLAALLFPYGLVQSLPPCEPTRGRTPCHAHARIRTRLSRSRWAWGHAPAHAPAAAAPAPPLCTSAPKEGVAGPLVHGFKRGLGLAQVAVIHARQRVARALDGLPLRLQVRQDARAQSLRPPHHTTPCTPACNVRVGVGSAVARSAKSAIAANNPPRDAPSSGPCPAPRGRQVQVQVGGPQQQPPRGRPGARGSHT